MLTYNEARERCSLAEHSHPQGDSLCMWTKAMAEFKARLPELHRREAAGEFAYVHTNGFILPLTGSQVWHAEIPE